MTRQSSRRQRAERSQQEGSQQASSGAGEGQASIYITRDEMVAMANSLQERLLKCQQEMMQTFFEQMRAAGMQNLGAATTAMDAGQEARVLEPNEGQDTEPGSNQQGLGGRPTGFNTGEPLEGVQQARTNVAANEPHEEYVPEFPRGQPPTDNGGLVDIIRKTVRGGLTNGDLEGVNRSLFTCDIRMARNPPEFKLPTLDVYNGKANPTDHLMRHTQHMEVLGESKEVMARCFPLYLTDIVVMWFR